MTAVKKYALLPLCGLTLFCARAQMPATNYDESQVPAYTLPDPLTTIAGKKVTDAETWTSERRPELLSLFESEVYGKAPGRPEGLHFEVLSEDRYTLGNMATRREIAVYFTESDAHFMTILLYIPNKRTDAVPVFLGLNFKGNHTICDDPLVTESVSRMKPREEGGSEVRAKGFPRAAAASRWPVEMLIANGYGLATIYRGDIDPDSVELSRHNAELAEVDDIVKFEVDDATRFHWGGLYGRIVTNPPYGERLLEREEAGELYKAFGKAMDKLPDTWRVYVLSSHPDFERCYGRFADKKRKLYNGMLKCDLFMYGKRL